MTSPVIIPAGKRSSRPNTLAALVLGLTAAATASSVAVAQPAPYTPVPAGNVEIDPDRTALSLPHVQVCQQGFESLYGVPDGTDPDEMLIIRGARQTYVEDKYYVGQFISTLDIAMPYERALPPGPPDGAVITGRITCFFTETPDGGFPLTPSVVTIEEEGQVRTLTGPELAQFR